MRKWFRQKWRDWAYVSLGGSAYITRRQANRLARMARDAMADTRPALSLKRMSAEQRGAILSVAPSPFRLDLGEMTDDEMINHLTRTSDYNKRFP